MSNTNFFAQNMTTSDNLQEVVPDRIGGDDFGKTVESGLYLATLGLVFAKKSAGGALGVTIRAELNSKEFDEPFKYEQTLYVTSGDKKGNKNYYTNKDGEEFPMPSFTAVNELLGITIGKSLNEVTPEERNVELYDFKLSQNVTEALPVITELYGKQVLLAIKKIRSNKAKKVGNSYIDQPEERFTNEIDKFLTIDGLTFTEKTNGATTAEYAAEWAEKWKGKTQDKYKEVTPSGSGSNSSVNSGVESQSLDIT